MDDGTYLDYGAPCFAVSEGRFARQVEGWEREGVVDRWRGTAAVVDAESTAVPRWPPYRREFGYVGVPGMQALARHLALDIDIRTHAEVVRTDRGRDRWCLYGRDGKCLGEATLLIIAMPSEQARRLLLPFQAVEAQVAKIESNAQWVAMLSYPEPLPLVADRLEFRGHAVLEGAWRESSKPGRAAEHWVLHAKAEWSSRRLDAASATVAADLCRAFSESIGGLPLPTYARAHRWRYAQPGMLLDTEYVWDGTLSLGVCGDWCRIGGVQGAFLSGLAVADRIIGHDFKG